MSTKLNRLTQHFNTGGQWQGETPEKPSGGQHWTISWKRVKTALNVLGASKAQREAIRKAHISDLLNVEPEDDPTEDLLPENIYATYLQDPTRDPSEVQFTVSNRPGAENITRTAAPVLRTFADKTGTRGS
jgi:hypothetical protein